MDKEQRRIAFESIALRAISRQWDFHARHFGWLSRMSKPTLQLHDGRNNLGRWAHESRTMSFSRHLVYERSWHLTVEVLKHEMAHQYCDEVLHVEGETPHGKTFQAVCHKHSIDATAAAGEPDDHENEAAAPNAIVEKIRRLLAMAEGRANAGEANKAEAEAAAKAARALMLKYNIELRADGQEKRYVMRHVGVPLRRIHQHHCVIANLLKDHYFVEVIWMPATDPRSGRHAQELQILGTPENVEAAEYVHDFVSRAAEAAWLRTVTSDEYKEQRDQVGWDAGSRAGYTVRAHNSFLVGYARGFASTLTKEREEEIEAGLVLADDPGLAAFFKEQHPDVRNFRTGRGSGSAAWRNNGFDEGKNLNVPPAARAGAGVPLLGRGGAS